MCHIVGGTFSSNLSDIILVVCNLMPGVEKSACACALDSANVCSVYAFWLIIAQSMLDKLAAPQYRNSYAGVCATSKLPMVNVCYGWN